MSSPKSPADNEVGREHSPADPPEPAPIPAGVTRSELLHCHKAVRIAFVHWQHSYGEFQRVVCDSPGELPLKETAKMLLAFEELETALFGRIAFNVRRYDPQRDWSRMFREQHLSPFIEHVRSRGGVPLTDDSGQPMTFVPTPRFYTDIEDPKTKEKRWKPVVRYHAGGSGQFMVASREYEQVIPPAMDDAFKKAQLLDQDSILAELDALDLKVDHPESDLDVEESATGARRKSTGFGHDRRAKRAHFSTTFPNSTNTDRFDSPTATFQLSDDHRAILETIRSWKVGRECETGMGGKWETCPHSFYPVPEVLIVAEFGNDYSGSDLKRHLSDLSDRGFLETHRRRSDPTTLTAFRWPMKYKRGDGKVVEVKVEKDGHSRPSVTISCERWGWSGMSAYYNAYSITPRGFELLDQHCDNKRGPQTVESGRKAQPRRRREQWLAQALLVVRDHPNWPDSRIAKEVEVSPGTLSRNGVYKRAAKESRANPMRIIRGGRRRKGRPMHNGSDARGVGSGNTDIVED